MRRSRRGSKARAKSRGANRAALTDANLHRGAKEFAASNTDPVRVVGVQGPVGIQDEGGDVGSFEGSPHVLMINSRERGCEIEENRSTVGVVVEGIQGGDVDVQDVLDDRSAAKEATLGGPDTGVGQGGELKAEDGGNQAVVGINDRQRAGVRGEEEGTVSVVVKRGGFTESDGPSFVKVVLDGDPARAPVPSSKRSIVRSKRTLAERSGTAL